MCKDLSFFQWTRYLSFNERTNVNILSWLTNTSYSFVLLFVDANVFSLKKKQICFSDLKKKKGKLGAIKLYRFIFLLISIFFGVIIAVFIMNLHLFPSYQLTISLY
ncbi:hypothetical protein TorRG33x02_196100 [Trema orientale]|uniref:Uncharacterized protein n=1 Tax=Trema orientale TaxID=63057 RepID=A0A2P5EG71_TREOI|nr:hypothetical protein TorRG33x02_196100 [Trema orientale]